MCDCVWLCVLQRKWAWTWVPALVSALVSRHSRLSLALNHETACLYIIFKTLLLHSYLFSSCRLKFLKCRMLNQHSTPTKLMPK